VDEAAYAAEFPLVAEEAVARDGKITHPPQRPRASWLQHNPPGLPVLITPCELSRRNGHPARSRPALPGCGLHHLRPAVGNPLTMLGADAPLEELACRRTGHNLLPSRRPSALVDHNACTDPRCACQALQRSDRRGTQAAGNPPPIQVLNRPWKLAGTPPLLVFEERRQWTSPIRGTMLARMRNLGEARTAANGSMCMKASRAEFTNNA